jgi:radical SAM protein with 4Fe4S-binding SPASM domain
MKKQSVKDYIVSQIATVSPHADRQGVVAGSTLKDNQVVVEALLEKIERRYKAGIQVDPNNGIEKMAVEEFVDLVIGKLKQNADRQIDCKTALESFVFSGRCKRLQFPYEINLDLTFRCNFRCIFCYASSADQEEQKEEMNIDEIFDIIDEFKALGGAFVLFGGGEPFLREDFLEIFKYTKSKGLWTYVISNGSLITEAVAYEYAKHYNPLFDKIQVSLDGSTAPIHDRQRGVPGAFEQTTRGIRNLTATGKIQPIINTVVTQINYDDIPNILELAIDSHASTFRCLKLHKIGRGGMTHLYKKIGVQPQRSEELYKFLTQKREELFGIIGIANDNACVFPMSTRAIREQFKKRPGQQPPSFACAAGTTKLAIAPDGGVVPCSYFYDFPELHIGTLREKSLREIWEDDTLWKDYREPLSVQGKCTDCSYLYACKTGCRIMSYVGCDAMGGPDNGCTYDPFTDNDHASRPHETKESVDEKI